ncbi:MAG: malto-oligosyltrehalose trehalohydrolase, partial [Paracoccus sp. (in: a-proteobacteria)]|nr:malto-oligosyltrehalose trehalohydrolase [Paracoccus sp. (in: a-proteobacteria)]
PDPASRLQSGGVNDASVLTLPDSHDWRCDWHGRAWAEAVIYELHIGTFTDAGTFAAAQGKLSALVDLGFTAIQLMPVGQFAGDRGWGYDGVLPYAPHPAYGTPGDLKRLIDAAHQAGLMVFLDVVMNHFGPEGAWVHHSTPEFFDPDRQTPWGPAINFDRPAVRSFWSGCAMHWLDEYRFDGLRLDAVHQIHGPGADEFMADLARDLRTLSPRRHLITEDERNTPDLRENAGYDASWNDDFHHAVHVALTGESDSYYASFAGDPVGDLCLALARGHIEAGQHRPPLAIPRGQPCDHLPVTGFVNAIQTHDQIGNRAHGDRLITLADPEGVATAYALLLVSPYIPMVFMGEERGETAPFQFFVDFKGDLAEAVRKGRAAEFTGIAALGDTVPDPLSPATFQRSKLTWHEDGPAQSWMSLTRQALQFRARHVVPLIKSGRTGTVVTRPAPDLIHAEWRFQAGTLALSLAFGQPDPDPMPDALFRAGSATGHYSLNAKAIYYDTAHTDRHLSRTTA